MCMYCGSNKEKESLTQYTLQYKGCLIVVKNVPCKECAYCGEKTISDDVFAKLEDIIEKAKQSISEITVLDYCKVA